MEEEIIWDQIVEKINSARVRERIRLEVLLALTEALIIAQQIETAVSKDKAMCKGAMDDAVTFKGPHQHGKLKKGNYKPLLTSQTGPLHRLQKENYTLEKFVREANRK